MAIGLVSGVVCYIAATAIKKKFGYDDALDVVGVHGVGGFVGIIMVAFFGSTSLGGLVEDMNIGQQLGVQLQASLIVAVYTLVASGIILKVVDLVIGLRVEDEVETIGLDLSEHEEVGYDL